MIRKALGLFTFLALSSAILIVSVFRNASIEYAFTGPETPSPSPVVIPQVSYELTYPGAVLPDHPLWPMKVLRDKVWLVFSFDALDKAEVSLLLADKRLVSAKKLFEKDKTEIGYSTLTKAEKYLEEAAVLENYARAKGVDTSEFQEKLSLASLKHIEVSEEILVMAPEDAKPHIITSLRYPQNIYNSTKAIMLSGGRVPPENPFE